MKDEIKIIIDKDPHSHKTTRYRVYYERDDMGPYLHYVSKIEKAEWLAQLWKEEDEDALLHPVIVNMVR